MGGLVGVLGAGRLWMIGPLIGPHIKPTPTCRYIHTRYRTNVRTAVQYSVRSPPEMATFFSAAHVMTVLTCAERSAAACVGPTAVDAVWRGGIGR